MFALLTKLFDECFEYEAFDESLSLYMCMRMQEFIYYDLHAAYPLSIFHIHRAHPIRVRRAMKRARTVALRTAGVSDVMAVFERWMAARGSRNIWEHLKLAREELSYSSTRPT